MPPNVLTDPARPHALGTRPQKSPRQGDDDDDDDDAIENKNDNDATVGSKSDDDDDMLCDKNAMYDSDITNVIGNENRGNTDKCDRSGNVNDTLTYDKIKLDRKTHCARSVDSFERSEQLQEILDTCLQHDDDDDIERGNEPHRPNKPIGLISTARVGQSEGKSDMLLAQADPPLKWSSVVLEDRAFRSLSARALSVDVDYPTPGQRTPPRLPTPVQDKPQRLTAAQEADLLEQRLTELRRQAEAACQRQLAEIDTQLPGDSAPSVQQPSVQQPSVQQLPVRPHPVHPHSAQPLLHRPLPVQALAQPALLQPPVQQAPAYYGQPALAQPAFAYYGQPAVTDYSHPAQQEMAPPSRASTPLEQEGQRLTPTSGHRPRSSASRYVTLDRVHPTPRTSMTSSPRHSPINFERDMHWPPSVVACVANTMPAIAPSVAHSYRSNRSRVSNHSVAVPSAMFDVVHRMTDALLQTTQQSRDDAVARERLLLQQQQLLLRETNEREQRTVLEALERDKVTAEREKRLAEEAMERDKVTAEREKRAAEQSEREKIRLAEEALERDKAQKEKRLDLLKKQRERGLERQRRPNVRRLDWLRRPRETELEL